MTAGWLAVTVATAEEEAAWLLVEVAVMVTEPPFGTDEGAL
jgi:hypothetical protein